MSVDIILMSIHSFKAFCLFQDDLDLVHKVRFVFFSAPRCSQWNNDITPEDDDGTDDGGNARPGKVDGDPGQD